MKVVLCGPARSGKSCLRDGLRNAVLKIPGAPYPYVITATPDGEGAWFQGTASRDSEHANELKAAQKGKFTPEFVDRIVRGVSACVEPLTLIDVGGKITEENSRISKVATHAIILSNSAQQIAEWREFCHKEGLVVIAEIISEYDGQEDTVLSLDGDGVWRGSIHYLERGVFASERPTVKALASLLAKMAETDYMKSENVEGYTVDSKASFKINLTVGDTSEPILHVGFTDIPADSDIILCHAKARLESMLNDGILDGGTLIKIKGPMTISVAMLLGHVLAHRYATVAVYDPKMGRYIVVSAHGAEHNIGDNIV